MRNMIDRVLSKLRDIFESWLAKALLAILFMVATVCLGALSALYALDSGSTITGCAAVLFYGFCFGWLAKWFQVEHMPIRKERKSIESLPPNQRALLHFAYVAKGALGREGDFSRRYAGDDLIALVSLGHIREIKGGKRPAWQLVDVCRRAIDTSPGLRQTIERDHAEWVERTRARILEEDIEAARKDILNMTEAGRLMLRGLLEADGPVLVDHETEQALIYSVGMRLLEFTPTLDSGVIVSPSKAARMAFGSAGNEGQLLNA